MYVLLPFSILLVTKRTFVRCCLVVRGQVFPYHVRVRGPPNAGTAAADRGLWVNKPYYTGNQDAGVIFDTFPELQVSTIHTIHFMLHSHEEWGPQSGANESSK